jgi:hypothetical protein
MINQLKSIGVTEVACLVDFGVEVDSVLASLEHLNTLRELCQKAAGPAPDAVTEETLAGFLRQKLPYSVVPQSLKIVDKLPAADELHTQVTAVR